MPVPVLLVTGFLGAGKTTVVNHLLAHAEGRRIAAVVNDFGAINIDSKLVAQVEVDTVSLSNGCICCTIREDFLEALVGLLKRAEPLDFVIVETSGVSDPSGVVATLADNACGYAAFTLMPADASVLTVEFKLNLMAPAEGEALIARGRVRKAGRTLTVAEASSAVPSPRSSQGRSTNLVRPVETTRTTPGWGGSTASKQTRNAG